MPCSALYSYLQKFLSDIEKLNLHINTLKVTSRGVYQVQLSNGIQIMIGRNNVLQRFDRFINLYPKVIGQKNNRVAHVDLRYSNGFAIKWQ